MTFIYGPADATVAPSSLLHMWQSIDNLLGRGQQPTDTAISATDFQRFFDKKVEDIRASTSGAADPFYTVTDCTFPSFSAVSADEVASAILKLPNKQCQADPLPTWLLKECTDDLAPFLSHMYSLSLQQGVVPTALKSAYICPRLKKSGLESADVKNYRPISNLKVTSKLLERLVASQLQKYLSDNNLLPDHQSAYRAFCSTETVIARVLSDIYTALDHGDIAALALLDLSAAFDTVDHCILLRHLQTSFGLSGSALAWFTSYLTQRQQYVSHHGNHSETTIIQFGVPQGSVLGPLLFVLYTADVVRLVEQYGFNAHQYADDTQLYGWCRPCNSTSLCHRLGECVEGVAQWMSSNRLQLNAGKTEFMWCVPPRRRHHLPADQLMVQSAAVDPLTSVRDLGVYLDSDMSMRTYIAHLVRSCYGILRQLRSIRRSLPRSALTTLVTSFISAKVDYCNVALAGLPQCDLDRVQSVVNAAARLTADARKYDHVTPLLKDLHWLRIPQRIEYKLCVLVHRCLNGTAPRYMTDLTMSVGSTARRRLRSASTADLVVPSTRRSTIGDRAFAVTGPRAWNSLPSALRTSSISHDSFKKHLKTFLFGLSFCL